MTETPWWASPLMLIVGLVAGYWLCWRYDRTRPIDHGFAREHAKLTAYREFEELARNLHQAVTTGSDAQEALAALDQSKAVRLLAPDHIEEAVVRLLADAERLVEVSALDGPRTPEALAVADTYNAASRDLSRLMVADFKGQKVT